MDKVQLEIQSGVIDTERLAELRVLDDGSIAFALELVEDFKRQRDSFFAGFGAGLAKGDFEALRILAHKIKSSAANIAAAQVSSTCGHIEKQCAAKMSLDSVAELIEKLKSEVAVFLKVFKDIAQ